MSKPPWLTVAVCLLAAVSRAQEAVPEPIRLGIIGLDTSHVVAFTKLINDREAEGALRRVRVTAAFAGGSPDIPASRDRIEGFTAQVKAMGVEIVEDIPQLLQSVDGVLLESVDGRPHLEQARSVIEAGLPLFIDKPLAGSLRDALAIRDLAAEKGVPWFSSSSLRFGAGIASMREDRRVGRVLGCDAYGPCTLEPHHPDLFWYGIHGVEILFTIMGPGCVSVTRAKTESTELVTGTWADGRIGTFRGIRRGAKGYGALVFGDQGVARSGKYEGYRPLVEAIARFFVTRESPVEAEVTLEIYAFMEAADESQRRGGVPVRLDVVLKKAGERPR